MTIKARLLSLTGFLSLILIAFCGFGAWEAKITGNYILELASLLWYNCLNEGQTP
jgi:hypothetical protein